MCIDLGAKDFIWMDNIIGFQRVVLGVNSKREETLFSILVSFFYFHLWREIMK